VYKSAEDLKKIDFIEFSRMCPQNFYTKSVGGEGISDLPK
jgi:hypothetical protein